MPNPDGVQPITATVRPTPPISIPYPTSSNASSSPFDDSVWHIPPIPSFTTSPLATSTTTTTTIASSVLPEAASASESSSVFSPITSSPDGSPGDVCAPPLLPPPPPSIGPWSPSLFRPVPSTSPLPVSAFHTPPPTAVVRPPPQPPTQSTFHSPQLSCILPPPPLASYLTDVSTPSASTQSTTVSNVGGGSDCEKSCCKKPLFPSPPEALPLPVKQPTAPGVSPGGISQLSSESGSSIREAVLCNACGQLHDPHSVHVYDYSESVDDDLLCRICRHPLVDPLDTKCGHTFCTPCLKSHLVVQALCPEDKQIINYLECQQSSNLVKRLLDKLLVTCPNSEHCDEVLCRCDLESHLNYWCRGTVVLCINAKVGCQFRAARALQTEHRRECRFQTSRAADPSPVVVRPANKSVVRFGPMPARRMPAETALMSSACFDDEADSRSPATGRVGARQYGTGGQRRSASPIRDCEVTTVELPWKAHESLGISFVGGSDTPLLCIVIQEIYLDGIVAMDGRLRPGDQILEANGVDLTQATHHQAHMALTSFNTNRACELTVYRERACSESGSMNSGKLSSSGIDNPFEHEEILEITLLKRPDKLLGIKLVGKKNLPGLYILGLLPDSMANMDGRLHKDDRILEINGVDLREGSREEAANIIQTAEEHVSLVVARIIRPQTPDIIRTASGDIMVDYGANCSPRPVPSVTVASAMAATQVRSSAPISNIGPACLRTPSTRTCREQVFVVTKRPGESLGMSVAGGVASQRGDTPVYVTNLDPNGVLGCIGQLVKGDVLLAVNEIELLGLSHERAVEALKATRKSCSKVTIRLLEAPETSSAKGNFLPSWLYWLQLPRYCQIPRTIVLPRTAAGSLGFSIVGGNNPGDTQSLSASTSPMTGHPTPHSQNEVSTTGLTAASISSPQPIVVKSIVPGTPAHRDGRLKCGDLILAVNQFQLTDVSHAHAVALLKHCLGDVHIRVVSWPGTIV